MTFFQLKLFSTFIILLFKDLDILLNKKQPPTRQRRHRTTFSDATLQALEVQFNQNPYPDIYERECLAKDFQTTEDRIQVRIQLYLKYKYKNSVIFKI
jgi:hypothetical protein